MGIYATAPSNSTMSWRARSAAASGPSAPIRSANHASNFFLWEETKGEITSTPLATAWAAALARELGLNELADSLRAWLAVGISDGFGLDSLVSGVCLLVEVLQTGDF